MDRKKNINESTEENEGCGEGKGKQQRNYDWMHRGLVPTTTTKTHTIELQIPPKKKTKEKKGLLKLWAFHFIWTNISKSIDEKITTTLTNETNGYIDFQWIVFFCVFSFCPLRCDKNCYAIAITIKFTGDNGKLNHTEPLPFRAVSNAPVDSMCMNNSWLHFGNFYRTFPCL